MFRNEPRTLVFFIDPIEESSYPVTETGYAMVHRAFVRAQRDGDQIFVVYPNTTLQYAVPQNGSQHRGAATPQPHVAAHRVEEFSTSPYAHYQSQRDHYDANQSLGSQRCHTEGPAESLCLADVDAVIFRQETGEPAQREALLQALQQVEQDVVVYQSPGLALDARFSSKALPALIDLDRTPRSFHTSHCPAEAGAAEKVAAALTFIEQGLGQPRTVIVKPLMGDNGKGVHVLGEHPLPGAEAEPITAASLLRLFAEYGELVVQEYVPTIRAPQEIPQASLKDVPLDRHDFGEIRFLLIDGTLPRTPDGQDILVARRTPTDTSLVADSGISYATRLTRAERAFLQLVGRVYVRLGIYFGGGDLIRTADPQRPFVFTDAARSVCGHAVVTGALNGDPYLIVDQVLDSIERRIAAHGPIAHRMSQPSLLNTAAQYRPNDATSYA